MRKHLYKLVVITSVVIISLTGCVPASNGTNPLPLTGDKSKFIISPMDSVDLMQYVTSPNETVAPQGLIVDDNNLILIMGGSSSCPPTVENASLDNSGVLTFNLKSLPSGTACTTDYTLHGERIVSVSTSFKFSENVTAKICDNQNCSPVTLSRKTS